MKGKKAKTFLLFPFDIFLLRTVAFAVFVLSYSGGTARELHPLPIIHSAYVLGECRRDGAALSRNRSSMIVGRRKAFCFTDPLKPAFAIHPFLKRSSWTHPAHEMVIPFQLASDNELTSSTCQRLTIRIMIQTVVYAKRCSDSPVKFQMKQIHRCYQDV